MANPAPPRKAPGIKNAITRGQIDREVRALLTRNSRSDSSSTDMANGGFTGKTDAVFSAPEPPIQIFHIEEVIFRHETDVLNKCAGYQYTRPTYRIDSAKVFRRWRAAAWRISSYGNDSTRHPRPMQPVIDNLVRRVVEDQISAYHAETLSRLRHQFGQGAPIHFGVGI